MNTPEDELSMSQPQCSYIQNVTLGGGEALPAGMGLC